jgi:nickel/cobalt exporter
MLKGDDMVSDDKTRLKTLLSYWVDHNREHSQEFREWADKASKMGEGGVAKDLLKAVGDMEKVTATLSGILKSL